MPGAKQLNELFQYILLWALKQKNSNRESLQKNYPLETQQIQEKEKKKEQEKFFDWNIEEIWKF